MDDQLINYPCLSWSCLVRHDACCLLMILLFHLSNDCLSCDPDMTHVQLGVGGPLHSLSCFHGGK